MTRKPPPPLSPFHDALHRLMRSGVAIACLILLSLCAGMIGYRLTEGMNWLDALENAAMILSGMGPASDMRTDGGKLFASLYALYSGLFLIAITGAMLLPVLHRMMQKLHIDDDDAEDKTKKN